MKPLIIVISGPPASGKTSLTEQIAEKFKLIFIHKDGIKELLFDTLGWQDREWSKKIGLTSYSLLYYFIEKLLANGQSMIVESNFRHEIDTDRFVELQKKYPCEIIQILCKAESKVLFERFKKRSESGERHPGHTDHLNYEEFKPDFLEEAYQPLKIKSTILQIDTTHFSKVNQQKIFTLIEKTLNLPK